MWEHDPTCRTPRGSYKCVEGSIFYFDPITHRRTGDRRQKWCIPNVGRDPWKRRAVENENEMCKKHQMSCRHSVNTQHLKIRQFVREDQMLSRREEGLKADWVVSSIVTSASEKSFLFSSTRRSPLLKLWGSLNYEPGKRSPQTDFQLRAPSTCDKKLLRLALLRRMCLGKLVRYTAAIVVAAAALFVIAVKSSRDPQIALPSSHGCCRH